MGRSLIAAPDRKRYLDQCAVSAKEALREFAQSAGMQEASLLVEERTGPVAATVARVAADEATDLVILSSSSKGFFGRQLLGSTTENLLRSAIVDLLILPKEPAI
jgi:nucleotide-binding universal stress UspA family protein